MDGARVRTHFAVKGLSFHLSVFTWTNSQPSMRLKFDTISKHSVTVRVRSPILSPFTIWSPSASTQTMMIAWLATIKVVLVLSAVGVLSTLRVTKTRRQTLKSYRLQHRSIQYVITWLLGIWTTIEMANGQHKVSHSQQGTCQCKYSMGTRLSPPIVLVDYMQKLVLIFIMIFFKPSITGVTNSAWCHIAWDSFQNGSTTYPSETSCQSV